MGAHIDFSRQQRDAGCASDLALDRLVTGEPVETAIASHVAGCARCAERLTGFRRDQALAAPIVTELRRRARSTARVARRRWLGAALPLVAAAALLVLLLPRLLRDPTGVRPKGHGAALALDVVVRHADGRIEALQDHGRVRAGDRIRFVVSAAEPGHLVILGLDAAGTVSVYLADGSDPHRIAPGARQAMPGSILLDATPGAERLVALECAARFPVADAVDAGRRALGAAARDPRRAGPLGLPGCQEAALTMDKSE
jgi:hypothetical protein